MTVDALLSVDSLTKRFADRATMTGKLRRRDAAKLTALDDVSLAVAPGETLGVVGESGSGKSTLARCIMRLYEPDSGSITFDGNDVLAAEGADLRALRRSIQMVYQDPFSSLNPRLRIGSAIAEPAIVHGLIESGEGARFAGDLLERVGLRRETAQRFPHEFSGGQRQRIAIARSLAVSPRLLIADEAVSALDVSIQAQLLALLEEIRRDLGLTMVFISHQLSVISRLADRVAIMYLGRVVEVGATADVFADPRHPYTQMLLEAHPRLDGTRVPKPRLTTDTPSPYDIPPGCRFHPRCPLAEERCARIDPPDIEIPSTRGRHVSACHVLPTQDAMTEVALPVKGSDR
jgi:oligopeptide/dipeptide ABC transporter ATP-binding protein